MSIHIYSYLCLNELLFTWNRCQKTHRCVLKFCSHHKFLAQTLCENQRFGCKQWQELCPKTSNVWSPYSDQFNPSLSPSTLNPEPWSLNLEAFKGVETRCTASARQGHFVCLALNSHLVCMALNWKEFQSKKLFYNEVHYTSWSLLVISNDPYIKLHRQNGLNLIPFSCNIVWQRKVPRKVDSRLPGKGNSNSHGARTVHQNHRWIRTSRLSIKNFLSCVADAVRPAAVGPGATLNPKP